MIDGMTMHERDLSAFEQARPRLEAIAYRLLGSASEAEDAAQESFLRWEGTDRSKVAHPPAWLTKVVTNVCLNQLDSARVRRESYVGQWLPEPLLENDPMLGPAETAASRDAVSFAMLDLLEILPSRERAVFVLRESFAYSHAEIAEILGTSEAGSQQALARARRRIQARGHRRKTDSTHVDVVVEAFLEAANGGDVDRMISMLSKDVTSRADGGGKFPAARRTVSGAHAVATYLCGLFRPSAGKIRLMGGPAEIHRARVNSDAGLVVVVKDRVLGAIVLDLDANRIREVRIQLAPDKLARFHRFWSYQTPPPPLARFG